MEAPLKIDAAPDGAPAAASDAAPTVAIVTPMLNEATQLDTYRRGVAQLSPPPDEIILVDGGSTDGSAEIAREFGFRVLASPVRGRAAQINVGVAAASADYVVVVHADTVLPADAIAVIRATLADPATSLAGFTPLLAGQNKIRWATSFHNWAKTWYAPLFFRPLIFLRGGRLLFGDHAMFFRRRDFLKVGGCDEDLLVLEDADLCLRLAPLGRIRLIRRFIRTSDRRIEKWGSLRANFIYLKVGLMWGFGFKRQAARFYPDIR